VDTLGVDVNRNGPHSIEVESGAIHVDGPFEVVIDNHGSALHVYLQLDDDLAGAVELSAVNHFVEEGSLRRVPVDVDESRAPVRGHLKIVTGYGSETAFVTVSVDERDETEVGVDVDESLSRPPPRPAPEERSSRLDLEEAPLLALGALAVVVALVAAFAVGQSQLLVALLVVLVGIAIGGVLLTR
jgi:hypothetical protein